MYVKELIYQGNDDQMLLLVYFKGKHFLGILKLEYRFFFYPLFVCVQNIYWQSQYSMKLIFQYIWSDKSMEYVWFYVMLIIYAHFIQSCLNVAKCCKLKKTFFQVFYAFSPCFSFTYSINIKQFCFGFPFCVFCNNSLFTAYFFYKCYRKRSFWY